MVNDDEFTSLHGFCSLNNKDKLVLLLVSTPPQHGRTGDVIFKFPHGKKSSATMEFEPSCVKYYIAMMA